MARHAGDDTETFRAVLETRRRKRNPEWHRRDNRSVPEFLEEFEEGTIKTFRGPYSTAGIAKAQFHRQRSGYLGHGTEIVRQYVQRSPLNWEDV